jgi:hypothetical protein
VDVRPACSYRVPRVILGGDLNVTQTTKDERYLARAEALLAAVEALAWWRS